MKKCYILFGFLLISILLFPKVINAELPEIFSTQCQEPESSTQGNDKDIKLYSSTKKLVLTKITKVFEPPVNSKDLYFHIINPENITAKNIILFSGELYQEQQDKRSIAPQYLNKNHLTVFPTECAQLGPFENMIVKVSSDMELTKTGSYKGKIIIFGENLKEPLEIDVSLNVKHDPGELIVFTIVGTLSATGIGIWFAKNSVFNEYRSEYGTRQNTIAHINKHIQRINEKKGPASDQVWKTIMKQHEQYRIEIEEHLSKLKPPADAIVKWYKEKDYELKKPEQTLSNENEFLTKIKNPQFTAELMGEIKNKNLTILNIIYAIVAGALAIPVTLFGSPDYFLGDPIPDIIIAFGVGFIIYETKKIGDAIKAIKKPGKS